MPIKNSEKMLKKAAKMEAQNDEAKQSRKDKKKLWETQSLEKSLYNFDKSNKRIPKASDIDQGSYSNLNYVLKQYGLSDCFLLTNLMGLAKTRPNFIQNEIIKVKNENEVIIGLYEHKTPPKVKIKENSISLTFEPVSSKSFYPVTKAEALKWKTCHLALWPVVIEIAYAKHLKSMVVNNKDQLEKNTRAVMNAMRPELEKEFKEEFAEEHEGKIPSDSEFENWLERIIKETLDETIKDLLDQNYDLRQLLKGGGFASKALTHLTGAISKTKVFANMDVAKLIPDLDEKIKQEYHQKFKGTNTSGIKAFQSQYSPEALKIYDKIQKKLKLGKIITTGFKGTNPLVSSSMLTSTDLPKVDKKEIALAAIQVAKMLKKNSFQTVNGLVQQGLLKVDTYEKWLENHNLDLTSLGAPYTTDEMRKKFILETVDFEKKFKTSKTKSGIGAAHGYLVLDAFENDGRLYIVLKNPSDMKTKINYKKSKKLPPEVKLPEQINKIKNECMMELNHFYKKLLSIDYDK